MKKQTTTDDDKVSNLSDADKLWEEIKDKPISIYALADQVVAQHCSKINIEPTKLYLTMKSSAVLPSLETALGKKFSVELMDKFIIVKKVSKISK